MYAGKTILLKYLFPFCSERATLSSDMWRDQKKVFSSRAKGIIPIHALSSVLPYSILLLYVVCTIEFIQINRSNKSIMHSVSHFLGVFGKSTFSVISHHCREMLKEMPRVQSPYSCKSQWPACIRWLTQEITHDLALIFGSVTRFIRYACRPGILSVPLLRQFLAYGIRTFHVHIGNSAPACIKSLPWVNGPEYRT